MSYKPLTKKQIIKLFGGNVPPFVTGCIYYPRSEVYLCTTPLSIYIGEDHAVVDDDEDDYDDDFLPDGYYRYLRVHKLYFGGFYCYYPNSPKDNKFSTNHMCFERRYFTNNNLNEFKKLFQQYNEYHLIQQEESKFLIYNRCNIDFRDYIDNTNYGSIVDGKFTLHNGKVFDINNIPKQQLDYMFSVLDPVPLPDVKVAQ